MLMVVYMTVVCRNSINHNKMMSLSVVSSIMISYMFGVVVCYSDEYDELHGSHVDYVEVGNAVRDGFTVWCGCRCGDVVDHVVPHDDQHYCLHDVGLHVDVHGGNTHDVVGSCECNVNDDESSLHDNNDDDGNDGETMMMLVMTHDMAMLVTVVVVVMMLKVMLMVSVLMTIMTIYSVTVFLVMVIMLTIMSALLVVMVLL